MKDPRFSLCRRLCESHNCRSRGKRLTWSSRDSVLNRSRNARVLLDSASLSPSNSQMRKGRRYSIQVRDSKGSIIFTTTAIWEEDNRRIAIAKISRLDGVIEAPSSSVRSPDQDLAMNLEAASFAVSTPAKKKPRH